MSHDRVDVRRDEVRLSDYAARVLRRWYVVVACVVAAVAIVVLTTVGSGERTQAQASVFLGQPTTPGGASVLPTTITTNPSSAQQFVRSEEPMKKAADASGIKERLLRSRTSVTSSSSSSSNRQAGSSAVVTITVRGGFDRDKAKTAVTSLADSLIDWANRYQDQKVSLLEAQVKSEDDAIATLTDVVTRAQQSLARSADVGTRAILLQTIADAGSRIDDISSQRTSNQLALVAAETVESAGYISDPSTQQITATSRRSSLIVAAIAGLIVGVIAALAWDALRRGSRRAA